MDLRCSYFTQYKQFVRHELILNTKAISVCYL